MQIDGDIVLVLKKEVSENHEGFGFIQPCPHELDILFMVRHVINRVLSEKTSLRFKPPLRQRIGDAGNGKQGAQQYNTVTTEFHLFSFGSALEHPAICP